jgi:hypothetical protein
MCTMDNIRAAITPHRKGSKITILCDEHGDLGSRYIAEEANALANDHVFSELVKSS